MIAALLALFLWLVAHMTPAPAAAAPAAVEAPAPLKAPAPRAVTATPSRGASADGAHTSDPVQRPASPATVGPTCPGVEVWDGERCVAEQLPTETTGRQYDPAH